MGKKIILPLIIVSSFCLISLTPIITSAEDISLNIHQLSSIENFLLRKAYPYEDKSLSPYKCFFSSKLIISDVNKQVLSSSSRASYLVELSGPMNSSWPIKSYNAQRIGRTPSSTDNNPGTEKWRFQTPVNGVESGAAIDNNKTIYFGSTNERIYALYPNGTLKWSYKTGDPIFSDPALAADGTIYITSCDHYLYALRPDGTLKWRFDTGEIVSSSPVIADNGTIYIGNSQGRVFAVNPNGTEQWHCDLPNDIYGSPALGTDGTIYIGCWDNRFYAINPNGTLKWWFPTGNHVKGIPSIAPNGTIYFGSWDGYLYALYPDGTIQWKCQVGSGTETTPALAQDGTIYVGGNDLYSVYPNGTLRWSLYVGGFIFHSCPAVASEGTIYVGANVGEDVAGKILAVNPNGTIRWEKTISDDRADSSPAIAADGTVYIGSTGGASGYLHAFGTIESNTPPNNPRIIGPSGGKAGTTYVYQFIGTDSDNNPIRINIDWGDGTTVWTYWGATGELYYSAHSWKEQGTYIIKAKTQDVVGAESNWTTFQVTMPLAYEPPHFRFFEWLFDRFPNAFPILRQILNQNS
jgi:outer membrane protein assembly factor BamB